MLADALFDNYLAEQRGQGRAQLTIERKHWDWKKFRQFTRKELLELTEQDVHDWFAWMFDNGLKKNTVHGHAQTLRHFLFWAKAHGYITFTPPTPPAPAKPDRRTLNPKQLEQFIQALEQGRNRLRNRAIFLLFLATGLRLAELGQLRLEDLDLAANLVRVRGETSKSQRGRMVPLGGVAGQAIRDYILWGRQGSTSPQLFLADDGATLGLRGIQLVVRRTARRAGVPWATPHILRHTFATRSLLDGRDAFQVKALLGHSSIRSTETYMDMAEIERSVLSGAVTPADHILRSRHGPRWT